MSLARSGVPFRLVSDAQGPGEHSRAMGVHAGTLEFYRQFGFTDEIVERGIKPETIHLREVSQTEIHYAKSPLSQGKAGHVHGGDRLPWAPGEPADNFAPLQSMDWQLHVYGTCDDITRQTCDRLHLPLHTFDWDDAAKAAGLEQDAAYLIRPDGYVALAASAKSAADTLTGYASKAGIRFSLSGVSAPRHPPSASGSAMCRREPCP